jgi:Amino-transferase class IV
MLDMQGFLAETNSANIFIVSSRRLVTPKRDSIMPGLTRGMEIAPQLGLTAAEENISPADIYMADEMFLTGTVNQIVPIHRGGRTAPRRRTARPAHRKTCSPPISGTPDALVLPLALRRRDAGIAAPGRIGNLGSPALSGDMCERVRKSLDDSVHIRLPHRGGQGEQTVPGRQDAMVE